MMKSRRRDAAFLWDKLKDAKSSRTQCVVHRKQYILGGVVNIIHASYCIIFDASFSFVIGNL